MIKLFGRENMRIITKILLAVFAFAPLGYAVAAPISQTAGSNLTGYNGAMGSIAGNQWNTMTNQRGNAPVAKADYGNCEAVVLRCAKPKCSGTGCADFNVAKSIASGCVNSNDACKKHGDALTEYIAGQLVSSSQAVVQQQQAAAQAAAAQQNAEQIAMMQQQMQMQMQQMQEQNNAQMASLQNALAESQRAAAEAQAAAIESATVRASAPDADTGLTAAQTAAAKSGVSEDTIARATITGQIMTSLDGVDSSLENLKSTMREAFRYAGCNEINGDNCTGPKRVKKFKELAMKFFEPYDALVDNLDDALVRAQSVGVDMTDIYMMLNGSCNRWGEYLCQGYDDIYAYEGNMSKLVGKGYRPVPYDDKNCGKNGKSQKDGYVKAGFECTVDTVVPPEADTRCVLNKEIGDEEVKQAWLDPDTGDGGAVIRIGCASSALQGSILGRRRAAGKKGGIGIDVLERLIAQDAPNSFGKDKDVSVGIKGYCAVEPNLSVENTLRSATVSKSLPNDICCKEPAEKCELKCDGDEDNVAYISPVYALCSVHAYNAGKTENKDKTDEQEEIKRIVGLKSTVISQQMYKQYTMVESMIKRLKVMLEKATLKASLQVASGTSDDGDEGSSSGDMEFSDCSARDAESTLNCVRNNYSTMKPYVDKGNLKQSIVKQIVADCRVLNDAITTFVLSSGIQQTFEAYNQCETESVVKSKKKDALAPVMTGITKLNNLINQEKKEEMMYNRSMRLIQ